MANIICVIVTYNRLELLKEAVCAVKNQTIALNRIIIVDNNSTDGTNAYLAEISNDPVFQIVTMPQNVGGSGGFSEGIKQAAFHRPDWIWVMDDDTIPQPNSLERLLQYDNSKKIGFIYSHVVWTDGTPHLMNQGKLTDDQTSKLALFGNDEELVKNCDIAEMASFVSLLVRGNIPWKLGLPYKEFFIWCDDAEYTRRISSSGYYGIKAYNSIVLHKTPVNYVSSLKTMPPSEAWKLYYGVRNESFLRRKRKGFLKFFFAQINCFRTHAHRIKSRHLPKEEEKKLLEANWRGLWDGFTFYPKIDYLK